MKNLYAFSFSLNSLANRPYRQNNPAVKLVQHLCNTGIYSRCAADNTFVARYMFYFFAAGSVRRNQQKEQYS